MNVGVMREALVVPPTISLERERPIQAEAAPILDRALEQHAVFVGRLRSAGVTVMSADRPAAAHPLSSIGDIMVMFRDGALLMRPTEPARRAEVGVVEALLGAAGIPILGRIEAPGLLDGADILVGEHTVYMGVPQERQGLIGVPKPPHGNAVGRAQCRSFSAMMGLNVVEVPIAANIRRLRAVAAFIDQETVLYAPSVVDGSAFARLRTLAAPPGEEYGAGVLAMGRRRVLVNLRCGGVVSVLRKARFHVDAIDLWEFGKVGITPSFLAAPLKSG